MQTILPAPSTERKTIAPLIREPGEGVRGQPGISGQTNRFAAAVSNEWGCRRHRYRAPQPCTRPLRAVSLPPLSQSFHKFWPLLLLLARAFIDKSFNEIAGVPPRRANEHFISVQLQQAKQRSRDAFVCLAFLRLVHVFVGRHLFHSSILPWYGLGLHGNSRCFVRVPRPTRQRLQCLKANK